ncbi:hypothetical protein [Anaerococcus hydrogenalis]|uniref:Uncharacterized protein n=1 Tax=Anaerococcus hydrogenalis ACS-025-V-Sch4 TaxID=879306 RepID=F0GYW6_9FIRM|nr:hypothetical protein [Anaerococcus hydrogenalis]EGC84586.1 hypothetical protein HMPREF9246_0443 [Anaerococcus hydrogenalis ACS-025-V-Sch4]
MADELDGLARLLQEFIEKYADQTDFKSLDMPPEILESNLDFDKKNDENNNEDLNPTN